MVNIKQVAREAGVSTATVSRVLNRSGYASKEAQERVKEAIDRLNYRPSAIARSLKQDKTYTIGILVPDISNPYFMQISKGIEDVVHDDGYHLIFASTDENPVKEAHLLNLFSEKRTDVIVMAASSVTEAQIQLAAQAGIHIVLVDRRLPGLSLALDTFLEDNVTASKELTEALIEAGHTRIGVIHGGYQISTSLERLEGYHQAMKESGIPIEEQYFYNGRFTEDGGKEAVRCLMNLSPKPTAIVALNNKMAFGAVLELSRIGSNIPEDVALASYGELEIARLLKGSQIWCMRQHPALMGTEIGKRILEVQQNPALFASRTMKQFKPERYQYR